MTSRLAPAAPFARPAHRTCCQRPMTSIEVSSSLADPGSTLALHTCSGCGHHVWERDGVELDRAGVLGVVRDRVAEGPAPRVPRPRKTRAGAVATRDRRDLQARLAGFSVLGQ